MVKVALIKDSNGSHQWAVFADLPLKTSTLTALGYPLITAHFQSFAQKLSEDFSEVNEYYELQKVLLTSITQGIKAVLVLRPLPLT